MNFHQFYSKVAPPVEYKLKDFEIPTGDHHLKPLNHEDMGRYAAEDVTAHLMKLKELGFNPMKLGEPMSDEEFKKFHGQTW